MKALALSPAAAGLLRALLRRVAEARDRVLLIEANSTDWQSLTFTGERHLFAIRITGADAAAIARTFTDGLSDAEFEMKGHIVADIATLPVIEEEDGSVLVRIEALTVGAD